MLSIVLLSTALAAGCGSTTPTGALASPAGGTVTTPAADATVPSPSSPPAAGSPAASPAQSPATNGRAELPTLSWRGLGPVRFGMTPDEASAALDAQLVPDQNFAAQRAMFACGYVEPAPGSDLPQGLGFMVTGPGAGTVTRIDVFEGPWRTDGGITVGDPVQAVRDLQPEGLLDRPAPYGDGRELTVNPLDDAATTAKVFDVSAEGAVERLRAGERPQVGWQDGCA